MDSIPTASKARFVFEPLDCSRPGTLWFGVVRSDGNVPRLLLFSNFGIALALTWSPSHPEARWATGQGRVDVYMLSACCGTLVYPATPGRYMCGRCKEAVAAHFSESMMRVSHWECLEATLPSLMPSGMDPVLTAMASSVLVRRLEALATMNPQDLGHRGGRAAPAVNVASRAG